MSCCYQLINPVVDYDVRKLCKYPYVDHPKGCPNYGKRSSCPPQAPLIEKVFDLKREIWVIWVEFDLKVHTERMGSLHPNWSERQKYCCLYWQPTARKRLEIEIARFKNEHDGFIISRCPEAIGINVTGTMESIGVRLDWPPRNKVYKIAVAGKRKIREMGERNV